MTDPNRPDEGKPDDTVDPHAPVPDADTDGSGAGYGNHGDEGQAGARNDA